MYLYEPKFDFEDAIEYLKKTIALHREAMKHFDQEKLQEIFMLEEVVTAYTNVYMRYLSVSVSVKAPKHLWKTIISITRKMLVGSGWKRSHTNWDQNNGGGHLTWSKKIGDDGEIYELDLFLSMPAFSTSAAPNSCIQIVVGTKTKTKEILRVVCFDDEGKPTITEDDPDYQAVMEALQ